MDNEFAQIIEKTRAAVKMLPAAPARTTLAKRAVRDPVPLDQALVDPDAERRMVQRYRRDQIAQQRVEQQQAGLKFKPRADVQFVDKWLHRAAKSYEMGSTFVLIHLMGPVTRSTHDARVPYCINCTFRRRRLSPVHPAVPVPPGEPLSWQDRCHGRGNGQPCDCPDDLVWFPHSLIWLLWLAGYACPIGYWEPGHFPPPKAPEFIELTVNQSGGCGC